MNSYRDVIALWPSTADLARDIERGIETVRKWRQRDSIPAAHWSPLLKAARRRGLPVTAKDLARIAA